MATCFVIGNSAIDKTFVINRPLTFGASILSQATHESVGGKGLNQAIALARCGVNTEFISAIGDDHSGEVIERVLQAENLKTRLAKYSIPSDQSVIILNDSGDNAIVTSADCATKLEFDWIKNEFNHGNPGDHVLLQGNLSYALTHEILIESKENDMTTILNPSPIQFQYDALWEFVDFAVLNEYECQELSKHDNTFQGIQKLSELGVKHVIVTRSGSDVLLYTESKLQTFEVPATNVVDTSGAGDVFCGILVGALLHKLTINESIEAAIRCASHSTTAMGTVSSYPTGTTIKSILGII